MDAMSPEYGTSTYQNIDPKQLDKFMRNPDFIQNLSSEQHEAMSYRVRTGSWTPNERIVYDAVSEGFTTLDSLPIATGLTSADIGRALDALTTKGVTLSVSTESIPIE